MYAHVTANTVTEGRLPKAARRLDTSAWVLGLADAPTELREACGYFPVVDTPRPADTQSVTHDRSVELVNGQPVVVWTPRPWSADEQASRTATVNDTTIRDRAAAALDANRSFLALDTPTNAQTLAQVKALTRQNNGLIRLALGQTADGTD